MEKIKIQYENDKHPTRGNENINLCSIYFTSIWVCFFFCLLTGRRVSTNIGKHSLTVYISISCTKRKERLWLREEKEKGSLDRGEGWWFGDRDRVQYKRSRPSIQFFFWYKMFTIILTFGRKPCKTLDYQIKLLIYESLPFNTYIQICIVP